MSQYIINDNDTYVVPEGALTKEQYVEFVMNMAAMSYQSQYNTQDVESGIQAACDAYNTALPVVAE